MGNQWGGADSFPCLPPRSATGWWTGSCSTCAAWQLCVAAPLAGTACARCLRPMLGAVPRRVPCLPGETGPSAVSLLSQPAAPLHSLQHRGSRDFAAGEGPRRISDLRRLLALFSFGGKGAEQPLTCMCLCAQLSCVLVARSTRSVPQHAVATAGSLKTVGSWTAVWPAVIAPWGCCGTPRASVCPPTCAPASLGPIAMPLAVPL